jgi:cytidylate kinase
MKHIFVAGPSSSGKSTLSHKLAQNIGFSWMDTGSVIRMTALQMIQGGISLPQDSVSAISCPVPPWQILGLPQSGDIPILVGKQLLDYEDPRLRDKMFDINTLYLAQALNPQIETLQQAVCEIDNCVISCRHAPRELVSSPDALPIYLNLSAEERVRRRANYEGKPPDQEVIQRIVEKEVLNISLGNLISPEGAKAFRYIMVSNRGGVDRSVRQLMLEVLRKYEGVNFEDFELAMARLENTPPQLHHHTHWSELASQLRQPVNPEGYTRGGKER